MRCRDITKSGPALPVSVWVLAGLLGASAFVFTGSGLAHGDAGHSTPSDAAPLSEDGGPVSISGFGETLDVTFIYRPFSPGEPVPLRIFVADLETNRPVSGAEISLTLTGPGTDAVITPVPVADSPGEYYAEAAIADDGDYSFLIEVSADEDFDLFSVDGFSSAAAGLETASTETAFSIGEYKTYFFLGGYVLVAFMAYSLGTRERKSARKKTGTRTETEKKVKVKVGELT